MNNNLKKKKIVAVFQQHPIKSACPVEKAAISLSKGDSELSGFPLLVTASLKRRTKLATNTGNTVNSTAVLAPIKASSAHLMRTLHMCLWLISFSCEWEIHTLSLSTHTHLHTSIHTSRYPSAAIFYGVSRCFKLFWNILMVVKYGKTPPT